MFVDACAIVSLMADEPTARDYRSALSAARDPYTSALAAWEAIIIMARPTLLNCRFQDAKAIVLDWLETNSVMVRTEPDPLLVLGYAVDVADKHGLGKRALSNFDCFHYAHAKAAGAPLLTLDRLLRETDVQTVPA